MWPDDYLDNLCSAERLSTWTARLQSAPKHQHVVMADVDQRSVGFACCFLAESTVHGTLLDNLHVTQDYQGHGIGKALMMKTAETSLEVVGDIGFYLWVLSANVKTLNFYKNLGGVEISQEIHHGPVGIDAMASKITWSKTSDLLKACAV